MKRIKKTNTLMSAAALFAALSLITLALSACLLKAPASTLPTSDSSAVLTAVISTAEAMRFATATAAAQTAVAASAQANAASPTPEASPTGQTTPTPTAGTTTPTVPLTAVPGALRVIFVDDVSVKDGTVFAPNQAFTKTWRIRNGGTATWTTDFNLIFTSGDQLGAPARLPIVNPVAPGADVELSINMVAPATPGRYLSNWMMQDASGNRFGLDPNASYPIYVDISVAGGTTTPAATPGTLTPTVTPGSIVSGLSLAVDAAEANTCPHAFNFTVTFTLSQKSTVTYRLEAGVISGGGIITLPAAVTTTLEAGSHTLVYTLDFDSTLEGYVQFHITEPEDVLSNQVEFKLVCP